MSHMKAVSKLMGREIQCFTRLGVYCGVVQDYDGQSVSLNNSLWDGKYIGNVVVYEEDLTKPIVAKESPTKNKTVPQLFGEVERIPASSARVSTFVSTRKTPPKYSSVNNKGIHHNVTPGKENPRKNSPNDIPRNEPPRNANNGDDDALESWDRFAENTYYESKDLMNRPLPDRLVISVPEVDEGKADKEILKMISHSALWAHPVPLVTVVKTQPELNESIDFLTSKSLIAIEMFGSKLDRFHDPAFVVIAALPADHGNEICHIYVYKYNLHTMGKLRPILLSNSSTKLIPYADHISDVMFNRIFTDTIWDVTEHKIVDLSRFAYEVSMVEYLYKASDISVCNKVFQPVLHSYDELVSKHITPSDSIHFPVASDVHLREHEYRILGYETLTTAAYNFLSRKIVSQFVVYFKLVRQRDLNLLNYTQRGIEYLSMKTDEQVEKILDKRKVPHAISNYDPKDILLHSSNIRLVTLWSESPLVITKVRPPNIEESIKELSTRRIIAFNILGPFVNRFADPAHLTIAIGYLEKKDGDYTCHVYLYRCQPQTLQLLKPILLSQTSFKIVPFVDYISDVLFKSFYPDCTWDAKLHHIIDLCRLDHEIREVEQLRSSNCRDNVPGRSLEALIKDYLGDDCDPKYFPFAKKKDVHESYLFSLSNMTDAAQNVVAKKVMSMFYLHDKMLLARDAALNETIKAGINRLALEKKDSRVKEKQNTRVDVTEATTDVFSSEERLEHQLANIRLATLRLV